MIHYDLLATSRADLECAIASLLDSRRGGHRYARRWRVPVCYEGEFAPDLEEVARLTRLASADIVALHRRRVPAGSISITTPLTAIYPDRNGAHPVFQRRAHTAGTSSAGRLPSGSSRSTPAASPRSAALIGVTALQQFGLLQAA